MASTPSRLRPAIQGLAGAGITLVIAALLPASLRLDFLAAVLVLTVGIYLGFAIIEDERRAVLIEAAGAIVYGGLALAGMWVAPWLLALGWLLHPLWDVAHHPELIRTPVTGWVIPFCFVYDLVVGAAVLYWWGLPFL